ncbi:hypothetical protein OSB04_006056 [Centaurea solstitialis]|uniref:Uncharacterized protein n=1 Tax=Centaurea solstitialis TaxID=347529 RepID=A0AA38TV09_9ASTR|nr:hypothetical protein OSB04_006056 [Centaurea solstitialis]
MNDNLVEDVDETQVRFVVTCEYSPLGELAAPLQVTLGGVTACKGDGAGRMQEGCGWPKLEQKSYFSLTEQDSWSLLIGRMKSLPCLQKGLLKWKAKALSIGGRRGLVQAVLESIATYYLSIFKEPKMGKEDEIRKTAWVKWTSVIRDKDSEVSVFIGSIFTLNISLQSKWVWIFKNNPNASSLGENH